MAKRVGPGDARAAQGAKGFRTQVPRWITLVIIVVVVLLLGFVVMKRTGVGGIGQMKDISPEIQAMQEKSQFRIEGKLPPYSPDVNKNLKPTSGSAPGAEKIKPK